MKLTQKIVNLLPKNYFKGMDLRGVIFEELNLLNFDFSRCNLSESKLLNVDMHSCNLTNTNLSEANLINSSLTSVNFQNANLKNTILTGSKLYYIDFIYVDLSSANLTNCTINENVKGISDELIQKFNIKIIK